MRAIPYIHDGILEVKIAVHTDRSLTYTVVILVGRKHTAVGVAKRHPEDEYHRQTGVDLALGRALHEFAERIAGDAGGGIALPLIDITEV